MTFRIRSVITHFDIISSEEVLRELLALVPFITSTFDLNLAVGVESAAVELEGVDHVLGYSIIKHVQDHSVVLGCGPLDHRRALMIVGEGLALLLLRVEPITTIPDLLRYVQSLRILAQVVDHTVTGIRPNAGHSLPS